MGRWLTGHGHYASQRPDESLHRLPNGEMVETAAREGRCLLTFDRDFGEIAALASGRPVTLVLFRLHNTPPAPVIAKLASVLRASPSALPRPAVVLVEESRHRIRYLPSGEA